MQGCVALVVPSYFMSRLYKPSASVLKIIGFINVCDPFVFNR